MNLPTAEVDVDQAKEAAEAYRKAAKRSRSAEDRMLATAYKAAAEGVQLLNLSQALREGGSYDIDVREPTNWEPPQVRVPRLACGRADLDFLWTNGIRADGGCKFQDRRALGWANESEVHRLPAGTFDPSPHKKLSAWGEGQRSQACRLAAMVPIVPPPLRPDDSLKNYHVLWEADWKDLGNPPLPPGDPALLRHLGGDMYAVLAVWNLTPIEQAVLAGRHPD